ncbi:MAG: hypothetical protein VKL39_03485 [Leptolyngbyaceae bacterium]|nr:hypothetical protein [Leptolyngbyaceae bacterium]
MHSSILCAWKSDIYLYPAFLTPALLNLGMNQKIAVYKMTDCRGVRLYALTKIISRISNTLPP